MKRAVITHAIRCKGKVLRVRIEGGHLRDKTPAIPTKGIERPAMTHSESPAAKIELSGQPLADDVARMLQGSPLRFPELLPGGI